MCVGPPLGGGVTTLLVSRRQPDVEHRQHPPAGFRLPTLDVLSFGEQRRRRRHGQRAAEQSIPEPLADVTATPQPSSLRGLQHLRRSRSTGCVTSISERYSRSRHSGCRYTAALANHRFGTAPEHQQLPQNSDPRGHKARNDNLAGRSFGSPSVTPTPSDQSTAPSTEASPVAVTARLRDLHQLYGLDDMDSDAEVGGWARQQSDPTSDRTSRSDRDGRHSPESRSSVQLRDPPSGHPDPRCKRWDAAVDPLAPVTGQWRKGTVLGTGSFGTVFRAQEVTSGRVFAVKQALFRTSTEADAMLKLQAELDICKCLKHPNIVAYLGHAVVDGAVCLFMEYLAGGSVAALLKEYGAMNDNLLKQATSDAVEGLNYLHNRNPPVVHRDIKGANLLVDTDFCVKLADFGCSKQQVSTTSFTTVGSIPWMAPEVMLQEDGYGRKADIWSLGCTVLEMATAETPWGRGKFENIACALRQIAMTESVPPIPNTVPDDCRDLLGACLQRSAESRPSTGLLLKHPFLRHQC